MNTFLFGSLFYLDKYDILKIDINYYYIPAALYGLSGTLFSFFMSVFSYVGDLSNSMPETRLTRFTISEASVCLGVISGYFVGSQVVIHLGDFYIFVISGACCSLAFVYGLLRIQNIIPTDENEGEKSEVKGK